MKEKSVVYYLSLDDIKDENILFNSTFAHKTKLFFSIKP